MGFTEFRAYLQARFVAQVATPQSVILVMDNAPEPTGIAAKWCRLKIGVGSRQQLTMGSRRYRTTGTATAELYVPRTQGTAVISALCDAVRTAFTNVFSADPEVRFQPPPTPTGEITFDAGWARMNVSIPYVFDEVA